jgi:hypothetical protein
MPREVDPAEFFAPPKEKFVRKAFTNRPALSSVMDRAVRFVRAPTGSSDWKQGLLRVVDAESGDVLAVVHPEGLRIQGKNWPLRLDC